MTSINLQKKISYNLESNAGLYAAFSFFDIPILPIVCKQRNYSII